MLYGLGIMNTLYFVASLILLIYMVLFLLNFEIGFLTLIFIRSSLDYIKSFSETGAVNLAAVVSLALIVMSVFYILYRRINILQFDDAKIFIVFITACGISMAYSPDLKESFADWLRLLSVFSVYLLTRLIFTTPAKIRMAITAILLSALLPVLAAYYQLFTGQGTVMDGGQARIVGTFLHPNAFASYLLIILIFCTAQILEGVHFVNKHFMNIFAFLVFVIFVFTLSRGAWIVFILAMMVMGMLRYRKLLGLMPPLLAFSVIAIPAVRDRIMNIFEPSRYAAGRSAWEWRLDTWGEIGVLIQEKPFFGHGLSMVEVEFGILTHNDYLRLIAEVGIIGLLIYLVLAFSICRRTWSHFKQTDHPVAKSFQLGVLAMILAFLVREFADNTLRNTVVMIYFWAFIALARNMALVFKPESIESHQPERESL